MAEIKRYLVDSDVLIDYLKGLSKRRRLLLKLREEGVLIISVINVVEIYSGKEIKDSRKRKIIDEFLSEFEIISLEENLAKRAGIIRMQYQVPFADAIVAATAIETNSILVTRNVKHFSKIKGLKLLPPELKSLKI
jgi:tRNA(fMet)-specific endonuclease VapC